MTFRSCNPAGVLVHKVLSADATEAKLLWQTLGFALLFVSATALLAVSAHMKVPFYPVPMTLQPLAVLLVGAVFGARAGVAVILLYLAEGIIGLPVFASGAGLAYLMGPTAGYLLGFVLAAGIVGYAADRDWTRSLVKGVAVMTLATATIYLLGVAWLATSVMGGDWLKAVQVGAIPFLLGDALKIAIAAWLASGLARVVSRANALPQEAEQQPPAQNE